MFFVLDSVYFINPMEQFCILSYLSIFTNSSICFIMICIVYIFFWQESSVFIVQANNIYLLVNLKLNILFEVFKNNLTVNTVIYLPTINVMFITILGSNLGGVFPFFFTVTSLFVVTFFFSFGILLGSTIIGLVEHRENFLNLFFPPSSPLFLLPALVAIETISYVAKLFSLSIRLFANMTAGHMLLKILISVSYHLFCIAPYVLFLIPTLVVFLILFLETGIAFLQGYIFVVLSIIYTDNVINLH